jgi:ketosteroid isomerase-like protein
MSQENVELVRRAYDAFRRKDVEALVALHEPTCEISPLIVRVEGGTPYRGHEGVRAFWKDVHAAFDDWLPEPEEISDYGDTLIVRMHFRGRGRDSGVTIDQTVWQVITVQHGLSVWWAIYTSATEALAAAGLSEQDAHADS